MNYKVVKIIEINSCLLILFSFVFSDRQMLYGAIKLHLSHNIALFILLLVGIVLGFTSLSKYKLSGDEMLTLNTATGFGHSPLINNTWNIAPVPPDKKIFTQEDYWSRNKIANVVKSTSTYNGNMVAYNILLYYYINATTVNDFLLRGLSALFYVISILLIYHLSKALFTNWGIAFVGAALFALNPLALHMGHDLRGYSFNTMTTLLASLVFIKLEKQGASNFLSILKWGTLLGILYGISLLGHYFTFYIIVGHLLYAMYSYSRTRKNIFAPLFMALFICTLFFIIWWTHGGKEGYQSMEIQDKYILMHTSLQTHTSVKSLIEGSICFINSVTGYYFQYLGYQNSSFFYVLLLPLLASALCLLSTPIDKHTKNSLIFLSILIISCIIFLQVSCIKSGHITSLVMTRFGAFICPYFMIVLGYMLSTLVLLKNPFLKMAGITLLSLHVILCIMCYPIPFRGYWFTYADVNGKVEKWRNEIIPPNPFPIIANDIMNRYTHGDTVVYNNFNTSQDVNLYLRSAHVLILQEVDTLQKEDYTIKLSK